jgi:hypothetical protein
MGLIVTFPHLDFFKSLLHILHCYSGIPCESSPLSAFAQILVIVYLHVLCHTLLFIWYPTVYHNVTHFVVVDPLRQPLASKSDRRPVGTLQRDPNAMEVDATNTIPFKKMTEEECQRHMKEGHCFKCHQQGHMSRECPKKSPRFQAKARATDTKETEEAPPSYPSGGSSSIAASTSEDKVRVTHAMVQAMNDEEKRRYYTLDQDFYDTDL